MERPPKVFARRDRFLVSSFHTEPTGDARVHGLLLDLVRERPAREVVPS